MTTGENGVLRHGGRIAAVLAVLLFAAAAVALASSGRATVSTQKGKLGKMLATGGGRTLFLYSHDSGGKSSCYGNCAKVWPPDLTHGKPIAAKGSGVNSKLLGTIRRSGGSFQVTYNKHPLYLYTGDKKPGSMTGENKNGFFAVNVKGNALKPKKHSGGGGCPVPGTCYPTT